MISHSGSRASGYQVCDDSLAALRHAPAKYGIELPTASWPCPVHSPEGQEYLGAMRCAANTLCEPPILMWQTREFAEASAKPGNRCKWLIYDVAHNIAKIEEHEVAGRRRSSASIARAPPGVSGAIRRARAIPSHRPAGNHPRRHGPRELDAVGQPRAMQKTFGTTVTAPAE